jgi:PAP2 superfamily
MTPSAPKPAAAAAAATGVNRRATARKSTRLRNSGGGRELGRGLLLVLWMAMGTSTSVVVSGSFAMVLAFQRRRQNENNNANSACALTVAAYVGAIFNGILSKLLKKMIQQARPPCPRPEKQHNKIMTTQTEDDCLSSAVLAPSTILAEEETDQSDHVDADNNVDEGDMTIPRYGVWEDEGMPSSHSMSLGFIWALLALHYPPSDIDYYDNDDNDDGHFHYPFHFLPSIRRRSVAVSVSLLYVLTCATYRCSSHANLHTWQQVAVGLTLGMVHATIFVQCGVQRELAAWITAHVLLTTTTTTTVAAKDDDDESRSRKIVILPAPLLAIPFIMTILIGAKVDLRLMQWLGEKKLGGYQKKRKLEHAGKKKKTR